MYIIHHILQTIHNKFNFLNNTIISQNKRMGSIEAEDHKSGIKKASTPKHKSVYTEASLMPSASYCDSICLDLK